MYRDSKGIAKQTFAIILSDILTSFCVSDSSFKSKRHTCAISFLNSKPDSFQNLFDVCKTPKSELVRRTINRGFFNK